MENAIETPRKGGSDILTQKNTRKEYIKYHTMV